MSLPDLAYAVSTWALPVVIAITFHEAAHGYAAWRLGDDTAYLQGRVSFNPLRHIDPVGTVLLPAVLLLAGGFLFGYAKPVPVNPRRLPRYRRDLALVAAAGPLTNILLALAAALLVHVVRLLPDWIGAWLLVNLAHAVQLNIMLALFNLLPLPPLDGSRVLAGLLPPALARPYARLEPYGLYILLGLLFLLPYAGVDILGWILYPAYLYVRDAIFAVTGLS